MSYVEWRSGCAAAESGRQKMNGEPAASRPAWDTLETFAQTHVQLLVLLLHDARRNFYMPN